MQQQLSQKEKTKKEEDLRLMAQRAREARTGTAPMVAGGSEGGAASRPPAVKGMALGDYGSDSEDSDEEESEDDEEAVREREQVRAEKRREREKEMRMSNMGTEMRAKTLAK